MATPLEELVGFLDHGSTQIRQIAVENLVPYSVTQPSIFKTAQLLPVRQLKLLVRDYKPIARNALTILVNLSTDVEVRQCLVEDDTFVQSLVKTITTYKDPNTRLHTMLLANLAKSDKIVRLLKPIAGLTTTTSSTEARPPASAVTGLLDVFIQHIKPDEPDFESRDETQQDAKDLSYLPYLFADLSQHTEGREYFLSSTTSDSIIPLTKLLPFTAHPSRTLRLGIASTIKNCAFDVKSHQSMLASDEMNVLPYILLPLVGPEEYTEEETESMLDDLQLLGKDKKRESDEHVLKTLLETLLLLTSTKHGREALRAAGTYYVVRETHLHVPNEEVMEACDRLVQVLMRDEAGEAATAEESGQGGRFLENDEITAQEEEIDKSRNDAGDESDDDDKIVEV